MGKFSDYLDSMKNQTDILREVVTEKSGVDCSDLSIGGVADVVKDIQTGGKDPVLQEKSVDPKTYSQEVTADEGYDGLSKLSVGAVTSNIDSNITPTNIRAGVSILGVQGNLATDKPDQTKTVTPTTNRQEVVADTGYELGRVIVEAVEPSDYYKDEESVSVTPTTESQKITPTSNKVFNEVNVGAVTSAIDSNILADNIKKDVTILGVTGTLEEGGAEDLTAELTAQDTALTSLESAVDKLPEPKMDRLQWKCDNMKTLANEFSGYTGESLDDVLVGLDTSQVTIMSSMFNKCQALATIPQLDTSNVTNMSSMFYGCYVLNSIPELNTSSCINMQNMFYNCLVLTTIPQLDTSNVTNMSDMFSGCKKLTEIPQLDTSKATNMYKMFSSCSLLESVPQLDTSKATNMSDMFSYASNLITVNKLDMVNVNSNNNANMMFYMCAKLTNLTLKNIKVKLTIGLGTTYGHLLTDESLINTAKELWDLTDSTAQQLIVSTPSLARFSEIYVKLITPTAEDIANDQYIENKKPCIVCSSTDEGAMTLQEYVVSKNWVLA